MSESESGSFADLSADLRRVAKAPDLAERTLEVVAIVETVAAPLGIRPVVVGGMAVYFWTASDDFFTYDIDVVMETPDALVDALERLGFTQTADERHWTLEGTDVFLEAPSARLDDDAVVTDVELPSGRTAGVLSRVDVLLDRLAELQSTGHLVVGQQVLALLGGIYEDESADLEARASHRRVSRMLAAMRALSAQIADGRDVPASEELHEIARAALRDEYA
jgi:hypothetical protein